MPAVTRQRRREHLDWSMLPVEIRQKILEEYFKTDEMCFKEAIFEQSYWHWKRRILAMSQVSYSFGGEDAAYPLRRLKGAIHEFRQHLPDVVRYHTHQRCHLRKDMPSQTRVKLFAKYRKDNLRKWERRAKGLEVWLKHCLNTVQGRMVSSNLRRQNPIDRSLF